MLTFGSLFSGIGGFDLGFEQAGMKCAWQCEIDKQARSVLSTHWPNITIIEDVRNVRTGAVEYVDLICGGFPCQDVSVAGKREGLAGKRSGLWFEFLRVLDELRPQWVVIENVPGLLSSNKGRDFATILQGLVELRYGVSWRILDAQYFGVAQRRRRVFIVGSLGDGRSAEVLFEREGGGGDIAEGRSAGKDVAYSLRANPSHSGDKGDGGINTTLITPYVMAHGQANAEIVKDGEPSLTLNHEAPIVTAFNGYTGGPDDNDAQGGHLVMAFTERTRANGRTFEAQDDLAYALTNPGSGGRTHSRQIAGMFGVRRLTPTECERLQGFPDGHTAGQSDSARYRQLGNAVAVPVAQWIASRILALT